MWKPILVGTTALAIAGSSLVYAQQRFGGPDHGSDRDPSDRPHHWQPSPEDRAAFLEARIAALRAGLQLSADQERNWPAFETAIRDLVKNRRERIEAWHGQQPAADPTERLKRRGDALAAAGAALQKLAEAQGPLYASLDDGQKRRFAMLSQRLSGRPGMTGGHGMGPGRDGMGGGHHGMMGRHGMRDDHGGRRHEHWREHHRGERDAYRGGDRDEFRRDRRSEAEGDRFREGPAWRDDRMDGRGGPDWRDERRREFQNREFQNREFQNREFHDLEFRGRTGDRGTGPMGGEERL